MIIELYWDRERIDELFIFSDYRVDRIGININFKVVWLNYIER